MASAHDRSLFIILIDDDEVDAEAVARLLYRQRLPYRLTIFADGRAAQTAFASPFGSGLLTQPYLILLDLNMLRMSGLEFLDWLRAQPDLARSIVFTFSTSEDPVDLARAHSRQIAGYLAKSHLAACRRGNDNGEFSAQKAAIVASAEPVR